MAPQLPVDRVLRIAGLSGEQLAVTLDPLPDGQPVVIRYGVPSTVTSQAAVVDDVLDQLEIIARQLFPVWLPAARSITTSSDFDRRVIRQLAHQLAGGTDHFGPFLADVAEAALRGQTVAHRSAPEIRARGLATIIAGSYHRDDVVLLVGPTDGIPRDGQARVAVALEWLSAYVGVWCTEGALRDVDRFPTWHVAVPGYVRELTPAPVADTSPRIAYPAPAGRPHPASVAEQTLERCLAHCGWASGRTWNQVYASDVLAPPIRVDLMWPDERCVVEIDGPDHRGILKYAQDRRRDNGLVLDGYAVLRFTNDEIADDPQRVLGVIERLLGSRRGEGVSA